MAQERRGFGGARQNDDAPKGKMTRESLQNALRIFQFMMPYKWAFIVGLALLAVSSLSFMFFPWASGEMLKIANKESTLGVSLLQMGGFIAFILIMQGFVSYFRVLLFAHVTEKGIAALRKATFQTMLSLPVPYLEERRVGELSSRITSDTAQLQDTVSITFPEFLRQIITLVVGIFFIFTAAPRLALLMIAVFPVIVVSAILFGRYIRKLSKERQDEIAASNVIVEETLQSINVVKAFTNERFEANRFANANHKIVKLSINFARLRGAFIAFVITALFGAIFFVMWYGMKMVENKEIASGDLVSFIMYTMIIGVSIAGLGDLYTQLLRALGATERLREILDEQPEAPLSATGEPIRLKGDIAFENVHFTYASRPDVPILKGVSIHIKAGQKVALVGQSGAGKSTIVQLLLQFYNANKGSIIVDGKDSKAYPLTRFRENIAIVPQEVLLFGGTIRENIAYGKPNATEEEIKAAARQANALSFIEAFPEGLETIVGERGIKLSGGQRQRIAIARALLRNPTILILDEATSSLDSESEKVVQEALETLMMGRTSIIIAHRLVTIKDVDCIYVLEQGKVVESGTHNELFAKANGVYHNLAKLQFEANEVL